MICVEKGWLLSVVYTHLGALARYRENTKMSFFYQVCVKYLGTSHEIQQKKCTWFFHPSLRLHHVMRCKRKERILFQMYVKLIQFPQQLPTQCFV
jgi:hypothetical protein